MPLTYSIEAANLSQASENKTHDDSAARTLGFAGGLVAGVEVYACHPVVRHWRWAWLERGRMDCRFVKPVYDGHAATVARAGKGKPRHCRQSAVDCQEAAAGVRASDQSAR